MVFIAGVIAVVGVCLLVSGDGFATPTPGDVLMLAAAVVRSVHVTAVSALARGRVVNPLNLTLVQSALCAIAYTVADHSGVLAAVRTFGPGEWAAVVYLGLACSVFAFLVQTWAIQQTSASRASLLMGTEPIWAVLIGLTIGQETLALPGILGAALIVTGTYLGLRAETHHRNLLPPHSFLRGRTRLPKIPAGD
ncbi:DMT family transporter [Arthrobacter sedimenti]|uniref:DMT family transporter n=1 Tax=Arthrobacter sedimenti TaxID=2694931 RepID=UPI000B34CB42|nr:DMT family transporter [Arthrobacter sedimenti]